MSDDRVYTAEDAGYVAALRRAEQCIAELEASLAIERQRVLVGIAQMEMATKRIEEMSNKLAALQHVGTGAGVKVALREE